MKFVANKKLVSEYYEFTSIEEAKHSPLATELFHFPFVKSVFVEENFVSITKYDITEWDGITMELREHIRAFIEQGKEVISETAASALDKTPEQKDQQFENLDDISKEIINILEQYVKPAILQVMVEILSFNPTTQKLKVVQVILQGACSGCPSSTFTLKNGIENMLKEMLQNKVDYVEAING